MLHGTEYQRYKQKLDRLQHKVKKSENARRELEIKFQRLMRERNECEKSASIHKSKYDTLLEHERERFSRNEELLEMLENVQAKAAAMASNTEKLKRLKTQQERIVINNWRRNAYFQQHLMYPNVVYSALPAPSPYEYHNRIINCIAAGDSSRPLICEEPTLATVQEPVYQKSNDDKSISNTSTVQHFTHPIVREIPCPSLPLMPIYDDDTDVPLFNEMFRFPQGSHLLRSVKKQPTPFAHQMMAPTHLFDNTQTIHVKDLPSNNQPGSEHIAYFSNRTKTHPEQSHLINDGLYHNKYLSSIPSSGNYVPVITPQHKISLDVPLTRLADNTSQSQPITQHLKTFSSNSSSIQPYSSVGYANQPQHMHYTSSKNQFPFIEDPTSSNTSGVKTSLNLTSQQMHDVMPSYNSNEPISSYSLYDKQIRNKTVEPSIYDANTKTISTDEIKPIGNAISTQIEKRYENGAVNEKSKTPWISDDLNVVHSYDTNFEAHKLLPRVESTNLRKAMNIPSVTDADNLSSLAHTTPKSTYKFLLDDGDDIHHIPPSVTSSKSNDSTVSTAYYQEPSNSKMPTDIEKPKSYSFLLSSNQEKSTGFGDKRRSSIDSGSLVKCTDDDSDLQKKSIAANVRRRYSVAANLLDLQKNVTNIEPFYLQSSSAINYRDDTNNLEVDTNRDNFDNEKFTTTMPIVSSLSNGQENKRISIDSGPTVKIEDFPESSETIGYSDHQISAAANAIAQQPVEAYHGNEYGHTEINDDVNHSDISSFRVHDNNAPTTSTTVVPSYDTNVYSAYESDEQAFVENAMENLQLNDAMEQKPIDELKQFDDGTDKTRIPATHSKTVTWADDPDNNYKKDDPTQFYETQNITNDIPSETYYAGDTGESQQFRNEYTPQTNTPLDIEPSDAHYQYDTNQYQAQTDATPTNENVYSNEEYYYPDEQVNQYEQYDSQQQQQDPQQIQYYANDMIGSDGSSMSRLPDGYQQQYQIDSTLLTQPKQDDYYTVSPGENYYSEYSGMDESQGYPVSTNYDNSHELPTSNSVSLEQHSPQPQQQQQQQQQLEYLASNEPAVDIRIPNYLQSDTDDSQSGYQNSSANKTPQNQDSDFDFSTNSDMN